MVPQIISQGKVLKDEFICFYLGLELYHFIDDATCFLCMIMTNKMKIYPWKYKIGAILDRL